MADEKIDTHPLKHIGTLSQKLYELMYQKAKFRSTSVPMSLL